VTWPAPGAWLVIGLAAAACSSRTTNDAPKVQDQVRPAPPPAAPARPPPSDERYDKGSLGAIHFEVSQGTPEAREHFTRGLLALHSFWYDEAIRQFDAAIAADRNMTMAYWGAAMSRCQLLWGDDDLTGARDALSRIPESARVTEREQAWVLTVVELLREGDVRTSRQRFLQAMDRLHARFPDDESATFLAAALLASTRPEDPDNTAVRKRAAALAGGVFEHNPRHPGAAHYLIHAYDTPGLAPLALPFAREYAQIAPAAFHARHMPAHIFSRLGMWKEAIASCRSAWDASVAAARTGRLSANHHDFHSLNWLIEMSFELGQRKAADAALATFVAAVRGGLAHQHRALYATQVASYMMRTGEWSRAAELLAPLDSPAADDPDTAGPPAPGPAAARAGEPHNHCAPVPASSPTELVEQRTALATRARAAAMQRDVAATRRYLGEIDALGDKLRSFLLTMQPKDVVARLDAAAGRRRQALVARASGNDRALLDALRQSLVDDQESTGGEADPSGFVLHEEIADTLLRLARPKDAAAEYALVLKTHPGRAHALLGAARAAARMGAADEARGWYRRLLELWSNADDGTDGLAEARAAVAARK
jgi:tetratricopeptide (TPR) repeat protein